MTSISELTFFGSPLVFFNEIDSTNDYLKNLDIKEPVLVITDHQINGRGQYGRTWDSECSKNLCFSFQFYPNILAIDQGFKISQSIALAIVDSLNEIINPEKAYIKWPNDIIVKNKKVCGILIEPSIHNNLIQKIVVGIGLNVNQTQFPENLPNASSLSILFQDRAWEINSILEKMIASFEKQLPILQNIDTRHLFNTNLLKMKEIVTLKKENKILQCINLGVNEEGFWILKNITNNEILRITSSQELEYVY